MKAPRQPSTWTKQKGVPQGQMAPLDRSALSRLREYLATKPRNLALLELGVASMLRGGDLLRLRVRDVTDHTGAVRESFPVIQGKISGGKAHTVVCHLPEPARLAVGALIATENKAPDAYLFTGKGRSHALSAAQFRLLLKSWCEAVGLDPTRHSSHTLRRTKAAALYAETKDLELVRQALGHAYLSSTQSYLGVGQDQVKRACLAMNL